MEDIIVQDNTVSIRFENGLDVFVFDNNRPTSNIVIYTDKGDIATQRIMKETNMVEEYGFCRTTIRHVTSKNLTNILVKVMNYKE